MSEPKADPFPPANLPADFPQAVVGIVDGQVVIHDPDALGMIAAIEDHNRQKAMEACDQTLQGQMDRVDHFKWRMAARDCKPSEVVIVIISVDDEHGREIANALMPGVDWQPFRDQGQKPYARGLAGRESMQGTVELINPHAGRILQSIKGTAVVVVDHNTAMAYEA